MNSIFKRVVFGIGVLSVLTIAASAIAATRISTTGASDPLARISAVNHAPTAADAVGPATAAWVEATDAADRSPQIGAHRIADARRLGVLPNSRAVYVVPSTMDRLCVLAAMLADSCGDPLSDSAPVSLTIVDGDGLGGSGPIAYGAAEDGVTAVSFIVAGIREKVPVHNNFYVFRGNSSDSPSDFSPLTATFTNGTQTVVG